MSNRELAVQLIRELVAKGVRHFCICAGARNVPLLQVLDQQPDLSTYHFFEERCASFFALGRARALDEAVAVVTTSGTAVAECLPAVIEASYQGLPLLVVSADRPSRFRGSGSPQSIEQVGLFSAYVEGTWDVERRVEPPAAWRSWSGERPFHVNVCLEEPRT